VTAARSQPYYLHVTHPDASKGVVARHLSKRYPIPPAQVAAIGDMPKDVQMFARSGLSVAMGDASPGVRRAARRIATSNEEEGSADAVSRFILRGPG
jgi:hydroxymethylpyrimidine pyrophosphatase-like HAD family hydrolase